MKQGVRDKRNYVIGALLLLVMLMAVGFAAFRTVLTVNGTARITSNWCVGFDNRNTSAYEITKGLSTGTNPTGAITFSGTACSTNYVPNSTLTADFYQPGDKIEYTLTIANKSSMTAAIESIEVNGSSVTSNKTITDGNIIWKVYMPENTTLASNATTTMIVSAEFQNKTNISSLESGDSSSLTVGINVVQDDGNGGFTPTAPVQTVYAINTNSIYKNTSTLQNIGTTYSSCSATGKGSCLKYTIENNAVTGAEVCFIKGGTEYCLTGWVDECLYDENTDDCTFTGTPTVFNSNKSVLQSAFTESNACYVHGSSFGCGASGVDANAHAEGDVAAYGGSWSCYVDSDGSARCDTGGDDSA